MPCNNGPLTSISNCSSNSGGIRRLLICPSEYITGTTSTAGTITSIGLSGGTAQFVEYIFNKNSASFNENEANNLENGSKVFTSNILCKLARRDVSKRNSLALVSAGNRNVDIITIDWNDEINYFPSANLISNESASGVAKADGSSYSLNFLCETVEAAKFVDSSIITALIA